MNSPKNFDSLPNELLTQILSYTGALDNEPPVAANYKAEDHLEFVPTLEHPLRKLAQVSKRWKGIALPMLVENSCVSLVAPRMQVRVSRALLLLVKNRLKLSEGAIPEIFADLDGAQKTTAGYPEDDIIKLDTGFLGSLRRGEKHFAWIVYLHHHVEVFLHFVSCHSLQKYVKGLTIHSFWIIPQNSYLRESSFKKEVRLMWKRIFKVVKPTRLTVSATPAQLMDLTNSALETFDTWAFSVLYHFLEFRLDTNKETTSETRTREILEERLENGLLDLHQRRPWTHMTYNEGTMIRGYSHYEWQEKIPPRNLPNLLENIARSQRFSETPKIRSCSYISYFPYSEHVKAVMKSLSQLKGLKHIEVSLADADMISEPEMLGKGQSADCWLEWELSYKAIIRELLNDGGAGIIFESHDEQTTSLKDNVIAEMESFAPFMRRQGINLRWIKTE